MIHTIGRKDRLTLEQDIPDVKDREKSLELVLRRIKVQIFLKPLQPAPISISSGNALCVDPSPSGSGIVSVDIVPKLSISVSIRTFSLTELDG